MPPYVSPTLSDTVSLDFSLYLQALRAAGVESNNWDCHTAVRSGVLMSQEDEGHFGSQGGTIQILPLLVNKTFVSVKHVRPACEIPQGI